MSPINNAQGAQRLLDAVLTADLELQVKTGDGFPWLHGPDVMALKRLIAAARQEAFIEEHETQHAKLYQQYKEDNCPSKHWNDGTDVCADCGAELNPPQRQGVPGAVKLVTGRRLDRAPHGEGRARGQRQLASDVRR